MAACIVCNQQIKPDDLEDVGDMVSLCVRLEKVLDEAVPQGSAMCASCKFDLAQIETYYTLLTVFKKRYSETTKQRLQSFKGETSRNVFHETSDYGSENLQSIFGEGNQSESLSTHLPLFSDMTEDSRPEISVPFEILDIRTVKEEFDTSLPVDSSNTNIGGTQDENPQPSPVIAPKKRGRPRKNEKSNNVSTSSLAAYPRKRGRPRKNEQTSPVPLNISMTNKKQGRPKEIKPSASVATVASAVYAKKRGRPRKSDSSRNSASLGSAVAQPGEWEPLTSMGGEAELADCDEVKTEAPEPSTASPSMQNALVDGGSIVSKPPKDQNPSYNALTRKPAGQRKKRQRRRVEQGSLNCHICNKVLIDKYRLQAHMKCHAEERPHVCSVCGRAFKLKTNLKGHMKIHTAEKTFKCEVCGKAFLRKLCLVRHSLVHTDSLPFPCDQCDKRFKSQNRLQVHIKLTHVQGRKFLCNICGLAFYTAGNLRVHILTHSEVKQFQCQTCGKRCSTKHSLKKHELSHSEGGRIKHLCATCGKSFLNKSYWATHIKLHTGKSKHFCTICNKSIISGSAYRTHMLIHQEQKPHQCSECGKRFRVKIHLKQHMMSHSDERPFKCACGQAFRQKSKLERHMRTKVHAEFEAKSIPAHTGNVPVTLNVPLAPPDLPTPPPIGPPVPIVVVPVPITPPPPIVAPLGMGDQHEMMLASQTDP